MLLGIAGLLIPLVVDAGIWSPVTVLGSGLAAAASLACLISRAMAAQGSVMMLASAIVASAFSTAVGLGAAAASLAGFPYRELLGSDSLARAQDMVGHFLVATTGHEMSSPIAVSAVAIVWLFITVLAAATSTRRG